MQLAKDSSHHTNARRPPDEAVFKYLIKTSSLVDHYTTCLGVLNTPSLDTHTLAWLFVYMRLYNIKDMKLGLRHNYQVKDISHIHNELSMALTRAYINSFLSSHDRSLDRVLIRNIMNFIPRGGGNGDELRLFILDIMRRHGIREGHRPGIEDPFLEQWHQKLHSGSTPEDITICEAYILFQETNSLDLFYKTLWERGGISVEFLRNMPHPLTHPPRHMPQLTPDLKHLLWILKQIHGGSHNFHYLLQVSKWQFDTELLSMLEQVQNQFSSWLIPGKIVNCRHRLKDFLRANCPRDPLMIDVSLDNMYKISIERMDVHHLNGDDVIELIGLTLQNIGLSYDNEKIVLCIDIWKRIKNVPKEDLWSREWGLQAFAALSYIQSMIQSYTDDLYDLIQPRAEILGETHTIIEAYITFFAEEVIRSQNTFSLTKLMDALFPLLRKTADMGQWKIVSHATGRATGVVKPADSLLSIHDLQLQAPHIMIVDSLHGTEDIPNWVTAILTTSNIDILSHISIRCRNANVLLATCYDHELLENMKAYEGHRLSVTFENNRVQYREDSPQYMKSINIHVPAKPIKNTSSKTANLTKLKENASDSIKIPPWAAIPFEMFQKTLQSNPEAMRLFNTLTSQLTNSPKEYTLILPRIREIITSLILPAELVQVIHAQLIAHELIISAWPKPLEEAVLSHVKKVWASVWNERAYLSRISRRVNSDRIQMGVVIQKAVPADYAFVIHTRNPVTNNGNEIMAEIVVGLGEILAGNSPGAPFCIVSKKGESTHTVLSYASKTIGHFIGHQKDSLIVRSDSNDEDLSDFSGAGLYDSFFINKPTVEFVQYHNEKLFWDKDFQGFMFNSIVRFAEEIEDIMKYPQDIEGLYSNESFYIVQTRNQV